MTKTPKDLTPADAERFVWDSFTVVEPPPKKPSPEPEPDPIHLYGTSEGVTKGWETRRRGGATDDDDLLARRAKVAQDPALQQLALDAAAKRAADAHDQDNDLATATLKKLVPGTVYLGDSGGTSRRLTARVGNHIVSVLTEMRDKGYALPNDVAVYTTSERHPSGRVTEHVAKEDIEGHPKGSSWRTLSVDIPGELPPDADLDKAARLVFAKNKGEYAVHSMRDVIIHEMGHVQAKKLPTLDTFLTEELKKPGGPTWTLTRTKDAMERVSRYAMHNPDEFIAEAFTRLYRGEKLHPESAKLYKLWGGPEIRS